MGSVTLKKAERRETQRVRRLQVAGDTVLLTGPDVEIRFPAGWAKKLPPWAEGPAGNIMCRGDLTRFNLVGVTKRGQDLTLTYVDREGDLRAETVSRGFLPHLAALLSP